MFKVGAVTARGYYETQTTYGIDIEHLYHVDHLL